MPTDTDDATANGMRVEIEDRVWWSDVDRMGVMYFARYIRFAEIAETEFFRSLGFSYDDIRARFSIWLARIHVDIDFRHPARLDDLVVCRAELVRIAGTSIGFRFPIERTADRRRLADMNLTIACLDADTLKTTRIPAELRSLLNARLTRG